MMVVWTSTAFRLRTHRRDNPCRYNDERGYWEFNDGVGPWCPSGSMSGMSKDEGEMYLQTIDYTVDSTWSD